MFKFATNNHWRWIYRRYWRLSIRRIGQGFEASIPGLYLRVGHHCPPCRTCGGRNEVITWLEENPGATICPDCCEHPDYQRDGGQYWCVECGVEAPYDYGVYYDD